MKRPIILVVLILIITLTCENYTKAEDAPLPKLTITLPKTQYIAGEPITITLKLTNESSEPIPRVFSSNEVFASTCDFNFTVTTSEDLKVYEQLKQGAGVLRIGLLIFKPILRPQEFWQCEQMFLPRMNLQNKSKMASNNTVLLLTSGLYKLTAKILWSFPNKKRIYITSNITSNTIVFQINDPLGIDAQAASLMESREVGGFITGVRGGKPKAISTLLTNYPESTYSKYARGRLILDQAKHLWDTRPTLVAEKKIEFFSVILDGLDYVENDKNKNMQFNDNILLYCARLAYKLNRENTSLSILKRIIEDFPKSDAAEAAKSHIVKWDRKPR